MRILLILWAIPLVICVGWYVLSYNDINFGFIFLSKAFHDQLFMIYEQMLGIPAEDIPVWLGKLLLLDTCILLCVAALRWHKHWLPQAKGFVSSLLLAKKAPVIEKLNLQPEMVSHARSSGPVHPAE